MSKIQSFKNIFHHLNALLAVAYFQKPAQHLTIIGVTGTDGKTTTSTLIYHLLKTAGYKVALISTVAAYIGDQAIDTGFHVTTPSPWALQRLLSHISQKAYTHVVIEATSHGLDQSRLMGVNPSIAVLTNITHEHLDYHGSKQAYTQAKLKLFKDSIHAVINQDDESYKPVSNWLKLHQPETTQHPYSHAKSFSSKPTDTFIKSIVNRFSETYNQANALAALKVAQLLNIETQKITQAISSFPSIPGRMEEIPNQLGIKIIVDFAHTPNSLKKALTSLNKTTSGKLIAVFGCAGLRDHTKRPLMGNIGAVLADYAIFTAEDPRTESVGSILYQMKQGIKSGHHKVISIADRGEAITFAIQNLAKPGDTIAVMGKGHEQTMNMDGKNETPWSDQGYIRQLLNSISTSKDKS